MSIQVSGSKPFNVFNDLPWEFIPTASWNTNIANGGVATLQGGNQYVLQTSLTLANSRASLFTGKSNALNTFIPQFNGNAQSAKVKLNFSRRMGLYIAINDAQNDIAANHNLYVVLGVDYTPAFVGTFTDKAIGFQVQTTTANAGRIRIIYHDGTVQKESAWVSIPTPAGWLNWTNYGFILYADGTGKIELHAFTGNLQGLAISVTDGPVGTQAATSLVNVYVTHLGSATAAQSTFVMPQPRVVFGF